MTNAAEAVGEAHPLDNPGWAALSSYHQDFAEVHGRARRYRPDVSVFCAVDSFDEGSWADLAQLIGPDSQAVIFRDSLPELPAGWTEIRRLGGHQLWISPHELVDGTASGLRRLGDDDVSQMLELVGVTRPGPFEARTIEMGRYHGFFEAGRLRAMAGERLHLDGYTEISAVCTHPDVRGRGLASALTRHVAAGIFERGERPFLHVAHGNEGALRVYEALGFTRRRAVEFAIVGSPAA